MPPPEIEELQTGREQGVDSFNKRRQREEPITSLADVDLNGRELKDVNLSDLELSRANFRNANLERAFLDRACLQHADFEGAKLMGARFRNADLSHANFANADLMGSNLTGACAIGARGLFGYGRADHLGKVKHAASVQYSRQHDRVTWQWLRFIGTFRLFGASYAAFIAITAYAAGLRWYNSGIESLREWAQGKPANTTSLLPGLVEKLPNLPVPQHLGLLLTALGLLAIGATVFAVFCPDEVKEATETRWTRELGQPLVEYRSAAVSRLYMRYLCAICYLIGGSYTLIYMLCRGCRAILFLLRGG